MTFVTGKRGKEVKGFLVPYPFLPYRGCRPIPLFSSLAASNLKLACRQRSFKFIRFDSASALAENGYLFTLHHNAGLPPAIFVFDWRCLAADNSVRQTNLDDRLRRNLRSSFDSHAIQSPMKPLIRFGSALCFPLHFYYRACRPKDKGYTRKCRQGQDNSSGSVNSLFLKEGAGLRPARRVSHYSMRIKELNKHPLE